MIAAGAFILGLLVGSFLNVVSYRLGTGRGFGGRSECLTCSRQLRPLELVPVLSFIILGGRCWTCRGRISPQYPLVELATGTLFWLVVRMFGPTLDAGLLLVVCSFLIVIVVYDLRHTIIPDPLVAGLIGVALLRLLVRLPIIGVTGIIATGATALGCFLFFWVLWRVSSGRWLGLGDGKLSFGLSLLLPPLSALSALVLSFWLGAVSGLLLIGVARLFGRGRYYTMKSELPFAPFLIAGTVLTLLSGFNVFFL